MKSTKDINIQNRIRELFRESGQESLEIHFIRAKLLIKGYFFDCESTICCPGANRPFISLPDSIYGDEKEFIKQLVVQNRIKDFYFTTESLSECLKRMEDKKQLKEEEIYLDPHRYTFYKLQK